jgi:malate synthase
MYLEEYRSSRAKRNMDIENTRDRSYVENNRFIDRVGSRPKQYDEDESVDRKPPKRKSFF